MLAVRSRAEELLARHPLRAADGHRLALTIRYGLKGSPPSIYTMASDGDDIQPIQRKPGEGTEERPTYSPDGRYLVYSEYGAGVEPDVYVVEIETNRGAFEVDFVIAGTGHDQDLHARPELRAFAAEIALWADRYQPPPELADARLARYPSIGPNFEFLEKVPGTAPFLSRIHDFTFGPTLSFGPSGCSISTLRLTVAMLVAGVTRGLFTEDVETHWQAVLDYPHMIP